MNYKMTMSIKKMMLLRLHNFRFLLVEWEATLTYVSLSNKLGKEA